MPVSAVQTLYDLRAELNLALQEGDWPRLDELDQRCRNFLPSLVGDEAKARELSAEEHEALDALLVVYRQVAARAQQERDELGEQLKSLKKSKSAAKAYQQKL